MARLGRSFPNHAIIKHALQSSGIASGSSAGTSTVAAIGLAIVAAAGLAAGVGSASSVSAATAASAGASAGVASASAVGASFYAGAGSSAGVASASGVGISTAAAAGSASGVGAASGTGISTAATVGASAGVGAAAGTTAAGVAVGSASGTGAAVGVGAATSAARGTVSGSAACLGIGAATGTWAGASSGSSTAIGIGVGASVAVGSSSGEATASGVGSFVVVVVSPGTAPRRFIVVIPQRSFRPSLISRVYYVPVLERSLVPQEDSMLTAQMHPQSAEDFTFDLSAIANGETVTSFTWDASSATLVDQGAALPSVVTRISVPAAGRYTLIGLARLSSGQIKTVKMILTAAPIEVAASKDPEAEENFELTWPNAAAVVSSSWSGEGQTSPQSFTAHTTTSRITGGTVIGGKMVSTNVVVLASGEHVAVDLKVMAS